MFKSVRVQIAYPCQGRCSWCSTHRKNPWFDTLYRTGISDTIHRFYLDVVRRLRPAEVVVSGGEPLLYPEIAWFLNAISDYTDHINLFTSYQFSKADLAKVLGLPADMEFEITMPSDDVMIDMTKEEVTKLIEEGLANRSDISALKANVIAKEAAVKAADSSLWPSISVEVSASRNEYNYYHSATTELNDDNKFTGFVGLTWDIFDGFYNRNVKRAAERDLEIAKQQLIKTELKTSADIWSAYYNFKASGSKRKHSRAFLNEAQTTFGLVVKGYEAGLEDILDLLTAQRDLSDARSKKIRAEIDWFISLAKLIHRAGGLSTQKDIDKKVLGAR